MNTESKTERASRRLAKVLAFTGDLMELAVIGLLFVMAFFSKQLTLLLHNDKSRELGLLVSVIVYVSTYPAFSTAGFLTQKEEYRERTVFLLVGWAVSVLCYAVFVNAIKWREFLLFGSPVILWASASFFLRAILPEEGEMK